MASRIANGLINAAQKCLHPPLHVLVVFGFELCDLNFRRDATERITDKLDTIPFDVRLFTNHIAEMHNAILDSVRKPPLFVVLFNFSAKEFRNSGLDIIKASIEVLSNKIVEKNRNPPTRLNTSRCEPEKPTPLATPLRVPAQGHTFVYQPPL